MSGGVLIVTKFFTLGEEATAGMDAALLRYNGPPVERDLLTVESAGCCSTTAS